jgi:hypothetical protein
MKKTRGKKSHASVPLRWSVIFLDKSVKKMRLNVKDNVSEGNVSEFTLLSKINIQPHFSLFFIS